MSAPPLADYIRTYIENHYTENQKEFFIHPDDIEALRRESMLRLPVSDHLHVNTKLGVTTIKASPVMPRFFGPLCSIVRQVDVEKESGAVLNDW